MKLCTNLTSICLFWGFFFKKHCFFYPLIFKSGLGSSDSVNFTNSQRKIYDQKIRRDNRCYTA